MHRKGESRGLCATWWQVQESVRRRVRSGTPTPMARRLGATATAAREESGVPEGWSSAEGAAAAAIALPGASTVAVGVWGIWFSWKKGKETDKFRKRCQMLLSRYKKLKIKRFLINMLHYSTLVPLCTYSKSCSLKITQTMHFCINCRVNSGFPPGLHLFELKKTKQ